MYLSTSCIIICALMSFQVPTVCLYWTMTTPKGWMWSTTRSGSWTVEASTSHHAHSSATCSSLSITIAVSSLRMQCFCYFKKTFIFSYCHICLLSYTFALFLVHSGDYSVIRKEAEFFWPRSLSSLVSLRACWWAVSQSNRHLSCTEASDSGLSQGCLGDPKRVPPSWPQAWTGLLWRGLDG